MAGRKRSVPAFTPPPAAAARDTGWVYRSDVIETTAVRHEPAAAPGERIETRREPIDAPAPAAKRVWPIVWRCAWWPMALVLTTVLTPLGSRGTPSTRSGRQHTPR